jgi:nucleotide-binding universal stress UspA family protein
MTDRTLQVVVAFDFSHTAEAALQRAMDLAQRADRHVFHFAIIIDPHRGIPAVPSDDKYDYRYAELVQQKLTTTIEGQLAANHVPRPVHFFVHARLGHAATEILVLAKGVGADLIIVGSNGVTGIERVLLGSVSEAVVRGAGCSVIVARPKSYADVELLQIVEVQPDQHHPYVPPHRYSYEETRLIERPLEWPLY